MFFANFLFLLSLVDAVYLRELDDRLPAFYECGKPLPPTNGYVLKTNRTVGTSVRVGCKRGYFRTGTPPFITCKEDGQWSDIKIECRAKGCGDPGSPRNGRRHGLQFNYLNTVYFTCNQGYKLLGPTTRHCLSNQTWSHKQPVCKPVACGAPPQIPNGNFLVYGYSSDYVYDNKVTYFCLTGFKRSGDDFLYCGKDAKWHGIVPYCAEIHCPNLNAPANGRLIAGDNYTKEGQRVRYNCHAGFVLFGPSSRTCLSSEEWSGPEPICFKCSEVGTPVFVRKELFYAKHGTVRSKSGHTVTVRYDDGQEEAIVIVGPGTRHYIIVEDRIPSKNEIFNGTQVLAFHPRFKKYIFSTVYSMKGSRYVVRYGGLWFEVGVVQLQQLRTLEPPRFCASCQDPGRPAHSIRRDQLTKFIPGMEVIYSCPDTFSMTGSQTRKCLSDGTWTGRDVTCTKTRCRPCPNVETRKVCTESTLAVIAKVIAKLPDDDQNRLLRYAIDVQYVLKNTSLSIQEGRVIVSVPLLSSWKQCACPRIPLRKKFILIGQTKNVVKQSKSGFILDASSFVTGWDLNVRRQIKLKCKDHVIIPNSIH